MKFITEYLISLKSKEGRSILTNFLSLSSLQFVGMILPLVILPYMIRVVGYSNYGTIMLSVSLVTYFQSITDFSFRITGTRDTVMFKKNPIKLNIIFSRILIIKSIFLILSILIGTLLILLYPPFYEERKVYFLSLSMLIGYTLFPEWFFHGIEKMKYVAILNIVVKILITIAVFLFISAEEDYWIYPLLQSIGLLIVGFLGQLLLIRKYKIRFLFIKWKSILHTIKGNFPVFINQFSPNLYNNTSTFLLGIISSTEIVGIYSAIKKIIDLAVTLLSIISRVLFPYLNRKRKAFGRYKSFMVLVTSVFIIGIIITHDIIFWFLEINNPQMLLILIVLALGLIGVSVYDVFGLNYYIIRRKDKLVMTNTIRASLIGLVLAFPLIYYFGILGAAINLTIARWMMGGGLALKYMEDQILYQKKS